MSKKTKSKKTQSFLRLRAQGKPSNQAYTGTSNPKTLLPWESLYQSSPEKLTVVIKINVFAAPNPSTLNALLRLDKLLRSKPHKKAGLTIAFFDPSSLQGKPPEALDHSFSTQPGAFEHQHQAAFQGKILYYIKPSNNQATATDLIPSLKIKCAYGF